MAHPSLLLRPLDLELDALSLDDLAELDCMLCSVPTPTQQMALAAALNAAKALSVPDPHFPLVHAPSPSSSSNSWASSSQHMFEATCQDDMFHQVRCAGYLLSFRLPLFPHCPPTLPIHVHSRSCIECLWCLWISTPLTNTLTSTCHVLPCQDGYLRVET